MGFDWAPMAESEAFWIALSCAATCSVNAIARRTLSNEPVDCSPKWLWCVASDHSLIAVGATPFLSPA